MIHFPDNPKHPFYGLMVHCLTVLSLVVVLAIFSNHFDKTEWKSILAFCSAYVPLMSGRWLAGLFADRKKEESSDGV
jgi:hypothetical protein